MTLGMQRDLSKSRSWLTQRGSMQHCLASHDCPGQPAMTDLHVHARQTMTKFVVQAIEASKKLQASLREEQSLLVQRMVVMQQRLLSPRQVGHHDPQRLVHWLLPCSCQAAGALQVRCQEQQKLAPLWDYRLVCTWRKVMLTCGTQQVQQVTSGQCKAWPLFWCRTR